MNVGNVLFSQKALQLTLPFFRAKVNAKERAAWLVSISFPIDWFDCKPFCFQCLAEAGGTTTDFECDWWFRLNPSLRRWLCLLQGSVCLALAEVRVVPCEARMDRDGPFAWRNVRHGSRGSKVGRGETFEILTAIELVQSTDISTWLLTVFFNFFDAFENLFG